MSLPLSRDDCEDALEQFFAGHEASRQIFDVLRDAIDAIGPAELRVTRSQIAFRRRVAFAWAWTPARYLRGQVAPLVLTHRLMISPQAQLRGRKMEELVADIVEAVPVPVEG